MKTFMAKAAEVEREWYVIDAAGQTLGHLATTIARILSGKNKPIWTPHVDTGDFVVVVNASQLVLTGNKLQQKVHRYHTGYPSGLREVPYQRMMERSPEKVVRLAVKGMLPKNALGRKMLKKLKVYAGPEHKHEAQRPLELDITR